MTASSRFEPNEPILVGRSPFPKCNCRGHARWSGVNFGRRMTNRAFPPNAYRSLSGALRPTRVTAAPDVVAPRGDASKDGLGGDGCRDRLLHPEPKLLAKNPTLRT